MDLAFSGARMADIFDEYRDIAHLAESRVAMARLSKKVVSQGLKGHAALSGLCTLKSQLDSDEQLMLDSCRFALFYQFVFFICCEPGQNNLALNTAIEAWRLVLPGKFRLLEQWCDFVQITLLSNQCFCAQISAYFTLLFIQNEKHARYSISKDTWQQLLEFTQREPVNLKGYDPQGAWPILIDAFVSHMHRRSGLCKYTHISDASVFPGLRLSIGHKRSHSTEEDTQSDTGNYISATPEDVPNFLCSKRARLASRCLTKWTE